MAEMDVATVGWEEGGLGSWWGWAWPGGRVPKVAVPSSPRQKGPDFSPYSRVPSCTAASLVALAMYLDLRGKKADRCTQPQIFYLA